MTRLISYFTVLFILTTSVRSQPTKSKTLLEQAYDFYRFHNFPKALALFDNAAPNSEKYITGLVIKGYVFMDSLAVDSGRFYFEKAEKLLVKSKDGMAICKTYSGFGRGYTKTYEFDKAVKYFMLADSCAREHGLIREQAVANSNIGFSFHKLGKIPIAQRYTRIAIALSIPLREPILLNRSYYTLISGFMILAENTNDNERYGDSMLVYLKEFEKCITKTDDIQLSQLNDLYSKAFLLKKEYDRSIKYQREALKIFSEFGNADDLAKVYTNIGIIYQAKKKYDSALVYFKRAEVSNKEESDHQGNAVGFYNLYECYKALGDWKMALSYYEKSIDLDRKFYEDKNLDLQKIREDFETKKTEQYIRSEKERTEALFEQKRNFLLYLSGAIILVLVLLAFFIYYRFKTKKQKERTDLQIQMQTAELSALKAQMNPHFIFNSLIAIQNYVYKHEPAEVVNYISNFAKLMRMILENSRKESVTLEKELELINYYLELQQLRFPEKFDFSIEVDPELDVESLLIPPMLSQPIIENAIEHGIMNKKDGKGNIKIRFVQKDSFIELSIKDNGVGRERAANIGVSKEIKHNSLATTITEERLLLLNRKSKRKFTIEVTDMKTLEGIACGTEVKLRMPEL